MYFLKDIPTEIYIFTLFHLSTFCLKIYISKCIVNLISKFEESNINIYQNLIYGYLIYLTINKIHVYLLYLIKTKLNTMVTKIYKTSLQKYISKINNNNKNYENTLSEIHNVFEIIYESYILTIPKTIIYIIYYVYNIFSHSTVTGLILLFVDMGIIYFYKYRNNIKEQIYLELYQANLNIKTQQLELIKTKNLGNIENILKIRDEKKNYEINYVCNELIYSDIINNFVELIIFTFGINYILLGTIKPLELLFLSTRSINFINHSITLIDQINIKYKYKTQIDNVLMINHNE